MPLRLLAAAFLLAGCGQEPAPPIQAPKRTVPAPAPAPPIEAKPEPLSERSYSATSEQGAAEVLKDYYALIGAGRYGEAYKLREQRKGAATEADFAASYGRYAEYRATVGTPSRPVAAGEWLYVEVPFQMYGRMKSGAPMASAGTMTLRRPAREPNAPWRIYTSR
jgi:hypothetical protein